DAGCVMNYSLSKHVDCIRSLPDFHVDVVRLLVSNWEPSEKRSNAFSKFAKKYQGNDIDELIQIMIDCELNQQDLIKLLNILIVRDINRVDIAIKLLIDQGINPDLCDTRITLSLFLRTVKSNTYSIDR